MLRAFILLSALTCAGTVAAQSKWVDKDGRVTYGDAPPVGVNAGPMRRPAAPVPQAEEAASDKADKKDDAKKKPLTAAEQDAAFRKRQQDAEKDREKQAKADSGAAAKRENCARAQSYVRTLETGRVTSTDAQGERYFLDDNQLAQENAKARQEVRDWCN
jgi:Domain of unknown function (DUF4124)